MAKAKVDIARLSRAMSRARLALRNFREERARTVKQYAGNHWGAESQETEKRPVNLLGLYLNVVGRRLIAKSPRLMLATFQKENKAAVSAMETWCNREIEEMRLAMTLQRVVVDALFCLGVCKVGLATPADSSAKLWNVPAGVPFAERVDLDDFVFDIHCRDFSEASFMGHRFRVPREAVEESKLYDATARKNIPHSSDPIYNVEGDERITAMQRLPYGQDEDEFEDMVDLWEVYVPRKRLVLTLMDSGQQGDTVGLQILRQQEWLGPDCGPYHFLAMGVVPGSAMPKGPLQDLIDLDDAVNRIFRKLIRQGERQKEILGVQTGATEDGARVINAPDGEALRVDNPELMKTMGFGGPNQQNFALGTALVDRFSWLAGNLDIMGGLSPQSKTASQDRMLDQNSSGTVADMQDRTVAFTTFVTKALCWYWWKDPFRTMKSRYSLPGLPGLSIERKVSPQQRQRAKFEELELTVDPYSLQHSTPQQRAQALQQLLVQIVQPMMPMLQQQGIMVDMNSLLTKLAHYLDMPDLPEIVTIQEPPQQSTSGGTTEQQPGMPAATSRTYTRENMPGSTREASDRNMVSSLMGVDTGGDPNAAKNGRP